MAEKETPMTLEEGAHCINQLNLELQRQTDAYRYFQATAAVLHARINDKKVDGSKRLPFITFHFPLTNTAGVPGAFKLDLNSLPDAQLKNLEPLFECLGEASGNTLLEAWERVLEITRLVSPTVQEAQHARSADVV